VRHHFRKRGKASAATIDAKKRTCMLYLQVSCSLIYTSAKNFEDIFSDFVDFRQL
jgi:hypothetical protein